MNRHSSFGLSICVRLLALGALVVCTLFLIGLPSAASHSITVSGCARWIDYVDGSLPARGVAVAVFENFEGNVSLLAPTGGSGTDFITKAHGCWSASISTAGSLAPEPEIFAAYIPFSFSGATTNVTSYWWNGTDTQPLIYLGEVFIQVTAGGMVYNLTTETLDRKAATFDQNPYRAVIRANQHAEAARNWTRETLNIKSNELLYAIAFRALEPDGSGGNNGTTWRVNGTIEDGRGIIGHEFGHSIINVTAGGRVPATLDGRVTKGPGEADLQHGDYVEAGIIYLRCSSAAKSGAWKEGFSDWIGGEWEMYRRGGDHYR
jgi:hypothetical protein